MPLHSRWNLPIPEQSLQALLFKSPTAPLPDTGAFYDAEKPDTHFITTAQFRLWSQRLAAGLTKAGLQPGDRVLLFSSNSLWYPVVFMGILMAGGVFTGANPGFVERELAFQLKNSEARFLICSDEELEKGIAAAKSVGLSEKEVFVFDDERKSRLGARTWWDLVLSEEEGKSFGWVEPEDSKKTICALNYSSGTTGVPKGVMISHYSYVANVIQFAYLGEIEKGAEEKTKNAKWLGFLPMYHAMAQTINIAGGVKRGIPTYIMKKFDFVKMLENIQRFKITSLTTVPPVIVALTKSPLTKKYDISSIIDIGSGAAPLSGDIIAEFEGLWPEGDRKMKQGWGMTEVTCSLLGCDPNKVNPSDSVGELNPNCSAKLMSLDEPRKEMGVGERGEIWVKGPNLMMGYWRNEEATKEVFVDGWMKTGDVGVYDEQGLWRIVDRLKELIKVKGNQVAPAELEALLLEHPMIADAAVVGVVIKGEELPRAYVALQETHKGKGSEKEVQSWLAERVAKHKRLAGGVVFVDAIPKNPSGKILRKLIKDRAKEEVGDKETGKAKL